MSKDYTQTFTVSVASPALVTLTEHNFSIGDELVFFTTGALPTNLSASGVGSYYSYFIITDGFGANSFQIALMRDGKPIITTGSQSGTHTLMRLGGNVMRPKKIQYI